MSTKKSKSKAGVTTKDAKPSFAERLHACTSSVIHDVMKDRDGIVLIPGAHIEAVIEAAKKKLATEGAMVKAIRAGMDPQAAYLKYRVF